MKKKQQKKENPGWVLLLGGPKTAAEFF